jgi:uncharacterized protein YcfJ
VIDAGRQHAVFWIVGMILGCALGGLVGQSFVAERGRRVLPIVVALSLGCGLAIGWALNAWIDFVHASATLRGL